MRGDVLVQPSPDLLQLHQVVFLLRLPISYVCIYACSGLQWMTAILSAKFARGCGHTFDIMSLKETFDCFFIHKVQFGIGWIDGRPSKS